MYLLWLVLSITAAVSETAQFANWIDADGNVFQGCISDDVVHKVGDIFLAGTSLRFRKECMANGEARVIGCNTADNIAVNLGQTIIQKDGSIFECFQDNGFYQYQVLYKCFVANHAVSVGDSYEIGDLRGTCVQYDNGSIAWKYTGCRINGPNLWLGVGETVEIQGALLQCTETGITEVAQQQRKCQETKDYFDSSIFYKCIEGELPQPQGCSPYENDTIVMNFGDTIQLGGAYVYLCAMIDAYPAFSRIRCLDFNGEEMKEGETRSASDGSRIECRLSDKGIIGRFLFSSNRLINYEVGYKWIESNVVYEMRKVVNELIPTPIGVPKGSCSVSGDTSVTIKLGEVKDIGHMRYECKKQQTWVAMIIRGCITDGGEFFEIGDTIKMKHNTFVSCIKEGPIVYYVKGKKNSCQRPDGQPGVIALGQKFVDEESGIVYECTPTRMNNQMVFLNVSGCQLTSGQRIGFGEFMRYSAETTYKCVLLFNGEARLQVLRDEGCLIREKEIAVATTLLCRGDPFVCTESDGYIRLPKTGCMIGERPLELGEKYEQDGITFICDVRYVNGSSTESYTRLYGCKDQNGMLRLANEPYYDEEQQMMCAFCNYKYQICSVESRNTAVIQGIFNSFKIKIAETIRFNLNTDDPFKWPWPKQINGEPLPRAPDGEPWPTAPNGGPLENGPNNLKWPQGPDRKPLPVAPDGRPWPVGPNNNLSPSGPGVPPWPVGWPKIPENMTIDLGPFSLRWPIVKNGMPQPRGPDGEIWPLGPDGIPIPTSPDGTEWPKGIDNLPLPIAPDGRPWPISVSGILSPSGPGIAPWPVGWPRMPEAPSGPINMPFPHMPFPHMPHMP
ncbi:unnamed protein product, partial [Anisakis simplex]|uniref:Abnormal cell migration protein 18-like fibronectin type I domain-containing protein n=1 Tax=Anisakis simplex TaxID=6269 RepID=A0A0M3JT22_ANISI